MEVSASTRRVERVRHEIKRREVEVARVVPVGANFVSVTFAGDALADFVSMSFDDHVKFMFADAAGEPVSRDYTPRHFSNEAGELTIEFAMHGEGKASDWARQAAVGDRAVIAGPRGSMIIPKDYDWHLLAGDATALPAIARRLGELPGTSRAVVMLMGDAGDRRALASKAQLDVRWVETAEELVDAVQAMPVPAGEGFAWAAGEAATMARLRAVLANDKGMPKEAMRIAAYWKQGASNHHENLG
jgi:NADPH-dependent ferric siderophore reductase